VTEVSEGGGLLRIQPRCELGVPTRRGTEAKMLLAAVCRSGSPE